MISARNFCQLGTGNNLPADKTTLTGSFFDHQWDYDHSNHLPSVPLSRFQSLLLRAGVEILVRWVSWIGQLLSLCRIHPFCPDPIDRISANLLPGYMYRTLIYRFDFLGCVSQSAYSQPQGVFRPGCARQNLYRLVLWFQTPPGGQRSGWNLAVLCYPRQCGWS